jgi:hypothetical protein
MAGNDLSQSGKWRNFRFSAAVPRVGEQFEGATAGSLGPRRRRKSVVDRRHATRHLHHRVHDGCGETTAISVPSGQARSVDEAKGIRDRSVAPP